MSSARTRRKPGALSLLALAGLFLAGAHANSDAPTPEQLCAGEASRLAIRKRLNDTAFVVCLRGAVWDTLACPAGLAFNETSEACQPPSEQAYLPQPPFDSAPTPPAPRSIYLYAWSGNDKPGPDCRDAVVVVDATPDSATFGSVVAVAFTPTWGNEPHHVGLGANNTVLAVGGIQAYLTGQPDVNFFNVTDAASPVWFASADPQLSAATDSFAGQADGGFWVSQMGDANGGSPGRMVRLGPAPNFTVQGEFPANPPPDFNPHGFAIDTARQRMITADYLELKSTLTDPQLDPRFRGNGTIIYRRTLRVWQLPAFDLVGEFRTEENESEGFMTVQLVGSSGVAASGNGKGVLWALNVSDPTEVKPAHVIGSRSSSCVFIPLAFSGGRRFFVTVLGLSVVQLVDTSDPWRWKTLQEISLPPGTYPHAATAARNGTLVAVSAYYIDHEYNGSPIGLLRQKGSASVFFFDVTNGGDAIQLSRRQPAIDFKTAVNAFLGVPDSQCGAWRPHGMAFKTITPPPTPASPPLAPFPPPPAPSPPPPAPSPPPPARSPPPPPRPSPPPSPRPRSPPPPSRRPPPPRAPLARPPPARQARPPPRRPAAPPPRRAPPPRKVAGPPPLGRRLPPPPRRQAAPPPPRRRPPPFRGARKPPPPKRAGGRRAPPRNTGR